MRSRFYPAFVEEMGREESRAKIQVGIWTGYGTVIFFGLVAWYAAEHGIIPPSRGFALLVVAKLVTNTLSLITLRARWLHLEFASLNIAADLFVMTGAIYLTGGPVSPLVPMYFIEAAVMALLTNLGLTIVTIVASLALFGGLSALIHVGALPLLPTPYDRLGKLTTPYLITALATFAALLVLPSIYIGIMVQRLRDKERRLAEHAQKLVDAAKSKSQFIANVTHELRTPIHGIMGLSELIGEGIYGPVTDAQREGVAGIRKSADDLLGLIDALLLLARAEAAKLDVKVGEVTAEEAIDAALVAGRWMAGKKDISISADVPDDLPVLHTDRAKLVQILVNLVSNAVKFTPEGGSVSITARALDSARVAIAVRDTGVGIPAKELVRIFEEFHQVDGSPQRDFGGAGIGLSLVKKLAGLIEAEVVVVSEVGKGSTFTLTLPLSISPRASRA